MNKKCPFCDMENERILEADRNCISVHSWYAVTKDGHILIIPRRHVKDLRELTADEVLSVHNLTFKCMNILQMARGFTDFNIGWNVGELAGQTIEHAHLYIIARVKGDVKDPTGGIRNVIPAKGNYEKEK